MAEHLEGRFEDGCGFDSHGELHMPPQLNPAELGSKSKNPASNKRLRGFCFLLLTNLKARVIILMLSRRTSPVQHTTTIKWLGISTPGLRLKTSIRGNRAGVVLNGQNTEQHPADQS